MLKKLFIILGIGIILIIIAAVVSLYYFTYDLCGNTQIGNYPSPDSSNEIKYYERDCGATAPFVDNLEINGHTILRAVTYGNSGYPFIVNWIDGHNVSVTTSSSTTYVKVYKIQDSYKNVQIIFDNKIKPIVGDSKM